MKRNQARRLLSLSESFPPSPPCGCDICRGYCLRPGWWTIDQARSALKAGYHSRMMLEMAPDRSFGVLSPAFKGCEGNFALQKFSKAGCTFFRNGLCQLYGTGFQPLECRFCHHSRPGQGQACHDALERNWNTTDGQRLVLLWVNIVSLEKSVLTSSRNFI